jgi:glycosyltransferase involved in cell wall biosynthesis
VDRLRRSPQIDWVFDAPDCTPYYRRCALSIAPIRVGGGTRIKIVEAFAHRHPVVATAKGCEGLEVADGTHLLVADEPRRFAEACARLLKDGELSRRLAQAGFDYFEANHTQAAVDACVRRAIDEVFAVATS